MPFRRPFVIPSSGNSRDKSYGTSVTHRRSSLLVGLRIIGVQQLIRLQVGRTFLENAVSVGGPLNGEPDADRYQGSTRHRSVGLLIDIGSESFFSDLRMTPK